MSSSTKAWDAVLSSSFRVVAADREHDDHVDEEPVGIDFTNDVEPLAGPYKVHRSTTANVRTGALWSIDIAAWGLDASEVAGHLAALTCVPNKHKGEKGAFGLAPPKPFPIGFVCKDGQRLFMPPHYAAAAFPGYAAQEDGYTDGLPLSPECKFGGSLWQVYPPQQQAVDAIRKRCTESKGAVPGCMVKLPCGHGKSVVVCKAMVDYGRVALVAMHMIGLVDQWIKVVRQFVPGAKVGYIKADEQRVEGVDIIIASIHTLRSHLESDKPYLAELLPKIGTVVLDEAHHGVANTFQTVMARINARNRLAVTATPRRKDGLFAQLQYIFGPLIFRSFRRPGDGQVCMIKYSSPAIQERVVWGRVRKDLMEDDMVSDTGRTALAVRLATHLAITQRRRVLVTTPRAAHVVELRNKLYHAMLPHTSELTRRVRVFVPDKPPKRKPKRKHESAEAAIARQQEESFAWQDSGPHGTWQDIDAPLVGMVLHDMSPTEREINYEANIVVATGKIMEEGISYDQWDTLLNLNDGGDPEQIVGRIQRAGDKKVPLVVDVWSPVSLYNAMRAMRLRFYQGERFQIAHHDCTGTDDMPAEAFWKRYDRKAVNVL
jgi:hypothetical protein